MTTALITGVTGQAGSYLAELLLSNGYAVTGVVRRSSVPTTERIKHLLDNPKLKLVEGDVTDASSITHVLDKVGPDEIYNLAAQSHVATSFEQPGYTTNATYLGVLNILEAIRISGMRKYVRMYQASSSEMFGSCFTANLVLPKCTVLQFQDESTPMLPNSPYAVAKLAAHNLCRVYRESYGINVSCGILFNHESPRRGEIFVTRKITKHAARFADARHNGIPCPKLRLGNLDARRDWGHAEDYVLGMWLMLQQDEPDDYVLATGETHTVREFVVKAFACIGEDITDINITDYVDIDDSLKRPCEVPFLRGDASKAMAILGWEPSYTFDRLVATMVNHDLNTYIYGV